MENFSKNKEGRKRGRPSEGLKDGIERLLKVHPDMSRLSRRQLYNESYGRLGIGLLHIPESFELADPSFTFLFTKEPYREKKVILIELGKLARQYSPSYAQEAAKVICKERMKTNWAIGYIKTLRGLGKDKVNGVLAKINTLVFNSYLDDNEHAELSQKLNKLLSAHANWISNKVQQIKE